MTANATDRLGLLDLPGYSIPEAARYLCVPEGTIRSWAVGRKGNGALLGVPGGPPHQLSFLDLAELHVLAALRRRHFVKTPAIRDAIECLRQRARRPIDERHPLISYHLLTDGLDLFVREYGQLINASRKAQTAMREVLDAALRRIQRNPANIPVRLFPYTRDSIEGAPSIIVIDPALSGGRPVIDGTGVAAEIVAERYKAGESVSDLTGDYGLCDAGIEEAIRYELQAAA